MVGRGWASFGGVRLPRKQAAGGYMRDRCRVLSTGHAARAWVQVGGV
jgi:hypothetical protein